MGKDYVREERVRREREMKCVCGCEGRVGREEGMCVFVCGKSAGKKFRWLI